MPVPRLPAMQPSGLPHPSPLTLANTGCHALCTIWRCKSRRICILLHGRKIHRGEGKHLIPSKDLYTLKSESGQVALFYSFFCVLISCPPFTWRGGKDERRIILSRNRSPNLENPPISLSKLQTWNLEEAIPDKRRLVPWWFNDCLYGVNTFLVRILWFMSRYVTPVFPFPFSLSILNLPCPG